MSFIIKSFFISLHILIIISFNNFAYAKTSAEFSNVYAFGDSFSYKGSWTENLMQRYETRYKNGENGFATGGANAENLAMQLANYNTAGASFNSNALYLIFMGSSDAAESYNNYYFWGKLNIIDSFGILRKQDDGSSELDMADLKNKIDNNKVNIFPFLNLTINDLNHRATLLGNFINNISSEGASYIVVLNNFKNTLRWHGGVNDDYNNYFDKIWVKLYNNALYAKFNDLAPNANIILIDNNRFIDEVINNPNKYFTATDININKKLWGFFNHYHPTEAAHKLLSQYVVSVIESPSRISMLREIPVSSGIRLFNNLNSFAQQPPNNEIETKYKAQLRGGYAGAKTGALTNKQLGFKRVDVLSGEVMLHTQVSEKLALGVTIAQNKNDIKFVGGNGKAVINETGIVLHGIYNFSNSLFAYAGLGLGSLKYLINRTVPLGIGFNSHQGVTKGKHYMAIIGTGYRHYVREDISLIPYINVNYQAVSINTYKERGDVTSTTMFFSIPERRSLRTEVGATLESDLKINDSKSITLSLGLSYSHDFKNTMKNPVKASVSDMPRQFVVPAYKADSSYLYIHGGAKALISNKYSVGISGSIKPSGKMREWGTKFNIAFHF